MTTSTTPMARLRETADFLNREFGPAPKVAAILGSGLGDFADGLRGARSLGYAQIPNFSASSVAGHKGRLVAGQLEGGVPVVCLQGRRHLYEGIAADEAVFPLRALGLWGVRAFVITNAAGGIAPEFEVGDLMLITDVMNMSGRNPLVGPNLDELGPRFPPMNDALDPGLGAAVLDAARSLGIGLRQGVYAMMLGPTYETPAEIRMLKTLGADAVGMSTVPEIMAARHMGRLAVGISCITNKAAGLSETPPHHDEVMEAGRKAAANFAALLERALPALARHPALA